MSRPLLFLAVASCAGAAVGGDLSLCSAAWLLALGAVLLVLACRAAPLPALLSAAFAIAAAARAIEAAAYTQTPLFQQVRQDAFEGGPVLLEGRAAADARELGERSTLLLDVESVRAAGRETASSGRARIWLGGPLGTEVRAGDRLQVWAQLRSPRGFGAIAAADPQAQRDAVHAVGWCKSPLLVRALPDAGGGPRVWAAALRAWARARLQQFVLPGQEQALVRALVLGDRTGLDAETAEAFRVAGTYHVLAISGAQVALVVGLVLLALRWLGPPPWLQALVLSLVASFYALVVGGDVPVVRAAFTAIVLVVGRAIDLDGDLANLLGLAALALVLQHPAVVEDVSFQLSFVATLAIVLLAPRLPRMPLRLDLALASSLAAQTALLPLLLVHFHRLCPAALLLNLAAVPLSGAVLVLGGLTLVGTPVPALARLLGDLSWIAAHALLQSGQVVRLVPAADLRVATPPLWALAIYSVGLVAWVDPRRRRSGRRLLAVGFVGMLLPHPPAGDGRLHLTVLDVGQGDALLVRSPRGRTWVVDAGSGLDGRFDAGESIVAPALWQDGVTRIEAIVVTHAHPDHAGGVPFLARSFSVGQVWEGPAPQHDSVYDALDGALAGTGVSRLTVVAGLRTRWDGVEVEVHGPRPPRWAPWTVRNDDSVVLSLRQGDVTFLLAGDVEAAGEALLPPRSLVLKVPHHGSRTSSGERFLRQVAPQFALVSAGFRNHFGHPHPEIVARYRRSGAWLARTDLDGTIAVTTDGVRVDVASTGGWRAQAMAPKSH